VARFLSPEWFAELEAAAGTGSPAPPGSSGDIEAPLVVEISVAGAPQGEVRYQVVVEGDRARVVPPGAAFRPPRVRLAGDYATFAEIASGRLSPIEALSFGRAKVSGDTAALSADSSALAGHDLVPPPVRAGTTF